MRNLQPDQMKSYFLREWRVLLVVSITGILYNVGMAAGPYFIGKLTQCLYDILRGAASVRDMAVIAGVYVLTIGFVQAMRAGKRYSVRVFANHVNRSMRHILYDTLLRQDRRQARQDSAGDWMTRAVADVDSCSEGMRKFTTEVFDTGVVMLVYLAMLLSYDWRLTLLALLFTPAAYWMAGVLRKRVVRANRAYKEAAGALHGALLDRVSHAILYRAYGEEGNRDRMAETVFSRYEKCAVRSGLLEGSLAPVYDAIAMGGAIMILYFGSKNVLGTGWAAWDIAAFTTFFACFAKLAVKVSHAAKLVNAVQKAAVLWKRIRPFLPDAGESDRQGILSDHPAAREKKAARLEFRAVAMGYPDKKLNPISLSVDPGEIVGITGKVASGKTMLGKALIGETPYTGRIVYGGKEIGRGERLPVSYFGHEPELLTGTIAENIALGDAVDVWKWLDFVDMADEVRAMPAREQTRIGAEGAQLSGGQMARLALARTMAHAGDIVVLDDPFAAVDARTEARIFAHLREAARDKIVFLISHRLYQFPKLDRILFLETDGSVHIGTPAEMRLYQPYQSLYEKQVSDWKSGHPEDPMERGRRA